MSQLKPIYDHDCGSCFYLGHYESFDLYFCSQASFPTVIARNSSEPSDYTSGLPIAKARSLPQPPREGVKDTVHNDYPPFMRALRVAYLIARDMELIDSVANLR